MEVTFSQHLSVYKATVYLKLRKQVVRKDLQAYINGEKDYEHPLIKERIEAYLRSNKVYNEQGNLSQIGKILKEEGSIPEYEEGKYQIWYTKDILLGDKILFFRRVEPKKGSPINELPLKLDKDGRHFLLPTSQNPFSTFEIVASSHVLIGEEHRNEEELEVKWIWKDLESSHLEFSGILNRGKDTQKEIRITKNEIPFEKNLHEFISELFPNEWDDKLLRYRTPFDRTLSEEALSTFIEDKEPFTWKEKYLVRIKKLPIMPQTKTDALLWRDFLLEKKAEKNYLTKRDFSSEAQKIVKLEILILYELPPIPEKRFMETLKQKNKVAWWHLQAPEDLQ